MKILIYSTIFFLQISVAQGQIFSPVVPVASAPPASTTTTTTTTSGALPSSGGDTNANGAANNAQTTGIIEGAVSAGMGVALMIEGHIQMATDHPVGMMEMMMGASLVAAGATDALQAQGYGNTGSQIAAGGGGPGTTTTTTPPVNDPYIQGLVNTAGQIAAQSGTSLQNLANQGDALTAGGGDGGGGGGGMGSFANHLSQAAKDGMAKAAANAKAHYSVSAVALEGGGGAKKGETPFDLAGLLNGLNNDRGPASVAGLQKTLNGQPIGVAQDNIFQQISRKYQSKIALRMFLPFQK